MSIIAEPDLKTSRLGGVDVDMTRSGMCDVPLQNRLQDRVESLDRGVTEAVVGPRWVQEYQGLGI